jgi:hypothetical protein
MLSTLAPEIPIVMSRRGRAGSIEAGSIKARRSSPFTAARPVLAPRSVFARRTKAELPPLRRLFFNDRVNTFPLIRCQAQRLRNVRALKRKWPASLQFNL